MEEVILFFMSYIFIFICYQIIFIRPLKKKTKKNKELLEVKYLITRYNLDIDKVNYKQLLQICALTSSFDMALTVSLIFLSDNLLMELLIGFISICILILLSYKLVYLFYKKKGMIKNGKYE